jgi:citrate lyase subunit beta/citryl-CoA lyase
MVAAAQETSMPNQDLSLCRSLLFLPASNPRAIEKARELPADMIILDLEDAVAEADKAAARDAALEACRTGFGDRLLAIRINSVGSPHHGADMLVARRSGARYVVLPKVESLRDIHDTKVVSERPIVAMIETPRGVLEAAPLASASAGLIAGTNDLAASLRIPPGAGRAGLSVSLQRIVLAGRAAGVAVFDGVYNRLDDLAGLEAEAQEGRAFGFDGKSVIHPSQIDTVNRVFTPSPQELDAADALIASATGGAQRHDGRMIEDLHVEQARLLVARARR